MISIRKIGIIGRRYQHAKRYGTILNVLVKYGFGDLVDVFEDRTASRSIQRKDARTKAGANIKTV